MGFVSDISTYIDLENLIAPHENPQTKWTGGNMPLDTGLALLINFLIKEDNFSERMTLQKKLAIGILNCQKQPGLFNCNKDRADLCSHDNRIGIFCGSYINNLYFHRDMSVYGKRHFWTFFNTGKIFWDGWEKPWIVAFYKTCIYGGKISFITAAVLSLYFRMPSDNSDDKLKWIMSVCLEGKNTFVDSGIAVWKTRVGPVADIMLKYYQDINHPFVKYTRSL